MKNINKKKIIFYFAGIIAFMFLAYEICFAQAGSNQTVEVRGYTLNTNTVNAPTITYGDVIAKRFIDSDNTSFFLDPSGASRLNELRLWRGIVMQPDQHGEERPETGPFIVRHPNNSTYTINFADAGPDDGGNAVFSYLYAQRFEMVQPGPQGTVNAERGGGKYVWDISESVIALDAEPSDVVVIDLKNDEAFRKSTRKFDVKVAGVISTDPKIHMGSDALDHDPKKFKPLALAGVVLCKVTTENGPIEKGDFLVTSSLPGHAMKAKPEQLTAGVLLGTALEKFDAGEGKILILVN